MRMYNNIFHCTNAFRLSGSASKLMTEKGLKYYPCSINYSGNLTAKSSYLVRSWTENYQTHNPL